MRKGVQYASQILAAVALGYGFSVLFLSAFS